ncbi:MAG: MATE family efflux transporter [Faecalibacillus faecis]
MKMFSNKELRSMIITLFFEQLLVMLVGIVDTFVVSSCGEAAVSGVSLVNQFNTMFIYLFTALASGGAIVVSQYIGNKDKERTILSSSQLLMFSIVFSIILSILVLIFNKQLLGLLFGKVESDVMKVCVTYLRISAYSYPALLFTMQEPLYIVQWPKPSNNVYFICCKYYQCCGKYYRVYVLKAGVAGLRILHLFHVFFSNHYHSFMF